MFLPDRRGCVHLVPGVSVATRGNRTGPMPRCSSQTMRSVRSDAPVAAQISTRCRGRSQFRFAVAYRALFGESPSASLHRPPSGRRVCKKIAPKHSQISKGGNDPSGNRAAGRNRFPAGLTLRTMVVDAAADRDSHFHDAMWFGRVYQSRRPPSRQGRSRANRRPLGISRYAQQ